MHKRTWIRSGIIEELDKSQEKLLLLVLEKIVHYYRDLYGTRACYAHPLSLSRLCKLTKRNSYAVTLALKILANTIPEGSSKQPPITYTRTPSKKNPAKRYYQIFLRDQ